MEGGRYRGTLRYMQAYNLDIIIVTPSNILTINSTNAIILNGTKCNVMI